MMKFVAIAATLVAPAAGFLDNGVQTPSAALEVACKKSKKCGDVAKAKGVVGEDFCKEQDKTFKPDNTTKVSKNSKDVKDFAKLEADCCAAPSAASAALEVSCKKSKKCSDVAKASGKNTSTMCLGDKKFKPDNKITEKEEKAINGLAEACCA